MLLLRAGHLGTGLRARIPSQLGTGLGVGTHTLEFMLP